MCFLGVLLLILVFYGIVNKSFLPNFADISLYKLFLTPYFIIVYPRLDIQPRLDKLLVYLEYPWLQRILHPWFLDDIPHTHARSTDTTVLLACIQDPGHIDWLIEWLVDRHCQTTDKKTNWAYFKCLASSLHCLWRSRTISVWEYHLGVHHFADYRFKRRTLLTLGVYRHYVGCRWVGRTPVLWQGPLCRIWATSVEHPT